MTHRVLFIFVDGFGIGKKDFQFNPFFKYGFKTFTELAGAVPTLSNPALRKDGVFVFPIDPLMGVEGLPQSGTGQTSIFCGINAAKYIGKHFGPYPYSTLIPIIEKNNILKYYLDHRKKVVFANAYPKIFFDYVKSGRRRLSVTTLSCLLSGVKLNAAADVWKGRALTAEITNSRWNNKLGYKLPTIKPSLAAKRLLRLARNNHFTLYEYFLTDHLGHGRYDESTRGTLSTFDDFLFHIVNEVKMLNDITLFICSDHGNIENTSIKTHTFNPALGLATGKFAPDIAASIKDLSEIKDIITNYCT